MNVRNIIFYVCLVALIIISFFLYSSRYYPLLNSDDALNILMTYYYKLPKDLYCWGQDRGGTLIPLISQIFHIFLGMSAVNSVSLANYIILILGYIGFSSLFKCKFTKLLFAIIWFFPPIRFIELTRYPLGVQYSLLGFSIFLLNSIDFKNKRAIINHFLILLVILFLSASIWVSDLAVVSITTLLLTLLLFQYFKNKNLKIKKTILAYLLAGIIGNYLFIKYAKTFSTVVTKNYSSFNDLNTIFQGMKILKIELFNIFTFQNEELLLSLFAWFVLVCIAILILFANKKSLKLNLNSKKWITFFIVDFFVVFGVILLSKWVYLNGMGHWYFVPLYISFSMAILLIFDNLKLDRNKTIIAKSVFFLTILTGAFSTIHYLKFIYPKTLRSKIDVSSEFLKLGEIGIIGEFWNSYIFACPDPSIIKATSHDRGVRNQELVDEVFAQPKLYVIKNMWMTSFPDTLRQFGYSLIKQDNSFKLGGCDVNEYIKIKRNETISFTKLKCHPNVTVTERGIEIFENSTSLKNKFVIWGPYFPLGIGHFSIKYKVKLKNYGANQSIARFDVAADNGKTILARKDLTSENLDSNRNGDFEIDFTTYKRFTNIEFRIYYYGNADLIIEKIQLSEK